MKSPKQIAREIIKKLKASRYQIHTHQCDADAAMSLIATGIEEYVETLGLTIPPAVKLMPPPEPLMSTAPQRFEWPEGTRTLVDLEGKLWVLEEDARASVTRRDP